MDLNSRIYELVKNAVKLNNAVVIKDDEYFYELDDKMANIFYIVPKKDADLVNEINKNSFREPTFSIISEKRLALTPMPPFKCFRETFQYSYIGGIKEIESDISIETMTIDDIEYFRNHYYRNGDDEAYLQGALKRGMLKAVKDNRIVGFVGEHPEHALGLLFVDENYRRQGIGKALEQAMINKILREGRTPIEHVVLTNESSKKLQASIEGMELDNGYVYWLF